MRLHSTFRVALCCLVTFCACNRSEIPESPKQLRDKAFGYAELKLTRATRHQALREELARVAAENGLPLAMSSHRITTERGVLAWKKPGATAMPDASNIVVAMNTAIPTDRRARLERQMTKSYPENAGQASAVQLERIHEVLADWIVERQAIKDALKLPGSDFGVSYSQGLLADLSSVDIAITAHRLLALEAINAAYEDDLETAAKGLPDLFRISAALAEESNLTMRVAAAQLHKEALQIVELIAQHPAVEQHHIGAMQTLIASQLKDWPDDANAWRGERAIGLHTYEIVRDGQLLSLLTAEEIKEVAEQGPQRFGRAVQKNLDEDQLFYLRAMREIIDACRDPYFARLDTLNHIGAELESRRSGPNQTFVADMLLGKDLQWGQRQQAEDRAIMQAWLLALSAASGIVLKEEPLNPLTGRQYRIVEEGSRLEVYDINVSGDVEQLWREPLVVPVFYR